MILFLLIFLHFFCRCIVPMCDTGKDPVYNTTFLSFAIPLSADGKTWDQCSRYAHLNQSPWDASLGYSALEHLVISPPEDLTEDEEEAAALSMLRDDPECEKKYFSKMTTEDCPEGHVFDKSIYSSTIISEVF